MDRRRTATASRPAPQWPTSSFSEAATAWGDLASTMADAFDTFVETVAPQNPPTSRRHRHEPGRHHEHCRECRPDSCHCDCCIHDADLVVYARFGEQRIVPIRIENPRSRTRQISLELSEFKTGGGHDVPISGEIGPTEFELEGCAHENVILGIRVRPQADVKIGEERKVEDIREVVVGHQTPAIGDVDDCVVGYADLRVEGCDTRPVRIAVALLPRDCDQYEIHCACGCC